MGSQPGQTEARVAELVNRLGRVIHCLQFSDGLNPAQWEALRYMARANRYSRTPSALAEFLGTTKGTASQTIKALEAKGYLRRGPEAADRRVCRLELTEDGAVLLQKDPMRRVEAACRGSGLDVCSTVLSLDRLLRGLQECSGTRAFGTCYRCSHFDDVADADPKGPHRCGLTREPLDEADTQCICVNYRSLEV